MYIKWKGPHSYDKEHKGFVLDKILVDEQVETGIKYDKGSTTIAVHRYLTQQLETNTICLVDPRQINHVAEKEEEL